jgi:hypothetical protein
MFSTSRLFKASLATMPRPLAIRKDSLLVQCMIAAVIFFVPQDAAVLGVGLLAGRATSRNVNGPVNLETPEDSLNKFYASRGLDASKFNVVKSGNSWKANLTSIYQ